MGATKELVRQLADPNLTINHAAQLQCQLAIQLEEEGDYEAARKAMGERWHRIGERPVLEDLDELTKGKVLLRVGALTGWIGSAKQIGGAQEEAKTLITESLAILEELRETIGVAEAQIDLARCYWREGALDEGAVLLTAALNRLTDGDKELKAKALLLSAVIEETASRHSEALKIYTEAAPLFQAIENDTLKGNFHNEFAIVLKNLGAQENRDDLIDRAFIEYTAASYHFGQAGHLRYQGCVENNLGLLFWRAGRFSDAHDHLDTAQALFTRVKDDMRLGLVDETRAQVMLAEGRVIDAEKSARRAVRIHEKGDERSLFAESLTTHGIALARLRHPEPAQLAFERAIDIAQQTGDLHRAGLAALALIEELWELLAEERLCALIQRATSLFEGTRDVSALKRLCDCSCRALSRLQTFPPQPDWTSFCLKDAVNRYESHFIEMALRDSKGKVTEAASLLGLHSHQALTFKLDNRHPHLMEARTPIARRRRSLISQRNDDRSSSKKSDNRSRKVKILHVEDNVAVADMMKDTLALEGWEVETCFDGTAAQALIESNEPYDLLLLDHDLPGMNGLQLVRYARGLPHRRTIPIVIFSAELNEAAARRAGANALLRKPQDLSAVAQTIASLLRRNQS